MGTGELFFIEGENGGKFPDSNALFVDDEVPVVIDPATKVDVLRKINNERNVALVFNSHYHVDHVRYNSIFSNAEFASHPFDAPAISSLDENARFVGIDSQPWLPEWMKVMRDVWGFTETKVSKEFNDLDEISVGANTLRFIHAPGHTPGHTCVEFVEQRAVYIADIDLSPFGPWYGNLRSSIDDFLSSVERLKEIRADTWFTGHEGGVLEGDIVEKLDEYAKMVHERDERILDYLSKPRKLADIVEQGIIYRNIKRGPEILSFFEEIMICKHLERLEKAGLIAKEGDNWNCV
ncbi:MAG: MBL fold metallo-hydrolase [Actinomycetota bacterium]|nr:MBL fold metallo-hydrolase [Actinomycetota bacterium]